MDVIKTGNPIYLADIIPHSNFGDVHLKVRAFKVGNGLGLITTDITERKRAEKRLKATLTEREVMLKEIHHRVKNNLTMLIGLIGMQAERVDDAGGTQRT